jgi:colanic acid biosynthesis glycosyl transferase WcaI
MPGDGSVGKIDQATSALKGMSSPVNSRRILIVGLNYAPDMVGVPKYTTEMAEELSRRGHVVEVICGPPYYPAWRVGEGYAGWRFSRETRNGVEITRTPLYVPAKPGGLKRIVHLATFGVAAQAVVASVAKRFRPDLVFTVAPTLTSVGAALAAAKRSGAASWLHIQDFEVDAAFELGLLKGDAGRRFALGLETRVFRRFDQVSTISPNMVALLERKGVDPANSFELRNWIDVDATPVFADSNTSYRQALSIAPDAVVALYSGNMAAKQGLGSLAELAAMLEVTAPNVTLVLGGDGPFKSELVQLCAGRGNVRFLGLQPFERLPELLGTADLHLLPQRPEAADLVLPSKLIGMLASGRPVVAMAEPGTGLAKEVEGCGLVTPAHAAGMAEGVIALAGNPGLRAELGRAARERAETRWRMSAIIDGFEARMEHVLGGRGQA